MPTPTPAIATPATNHSPLLPPRTDLTLLPPACARSPDLAAESKTDHPERSLPRISGDKKRKASCEWDLMQILRAQLGESGASEVIQQHRETFITKEDWKGFGAATGELVAPPPATQFRPAPL